MKDIAGELGISVVTVSRALKDHPDIGTETKKRVREMAAKAGYRPNLLARGLVTRRTYVIGLVIPDLGHSFFAEICRAVERQVFPHGYHVLIANSDERADVEKEHVESLIARQVDGVILASSQPPGDTAFFESVRERNVPLVMIDRWYPGIETSYVGVDDERIGVLATEHLADCGCRRIAHLRGQEIPPGEGRLRGYQEVLKRHGLKAPDGYVQRTDASDAAGRQAMERLLETGPPPDGVFCYNDAVAIGAMNAILDAGLRIPEDIALAGAGNVRHSGSLRVPLTTVDQQSALVGERSGELMMKLILEPEDLEPERILIPPRLIVRQSSLTRAGLG